jgi:hypothetical protein
MGNCIVSGLHSQDLSSGSQKQEEEQADVHHQEDAQVGEGGILLEKSKDMYRFAVEPPRYLQISSIFTSLVTSLPVKWLYMGFHKATLKIKDDVHSWDCTSMQWSTCFWWTRLGLLTMVVVLVGLLLVLLGEEHPLCMVPVLVLVVVVLGGSSCSW